MPSLKAIRKRIASVKSTQKITRAMKMVAGARLNRAQQRITALRPYAVKTQAVLSSIAAPVDALADEPGERGGRASRRQNEPIEPEVEMELTARRRERQRALWRKRRETKGAQAKPPRSSPPPRKARAARRPTSDRGLCGAFNTNINKRAERDWREPDRGRVRTSSSTTIGRKGREYLARRGATIIEDFPGVWDKLGLATARSVAASAHRRSTASEVDAVYLVYNEFKSAMTQKVVVERLLPRHRVRRRRQTQRSRSHDRTRVHLRAEQGRAARAPRADVRRDHDLPRALETRPASSARR